MVFSNQTNYIEHKDSKKLTDNIDFLGFITKKAFLLPSSNLLRAFFDLINIRDKDSNASNLVVATFIYLE